MPSLRRREKTRDKISEAIDLLEEVSHSDMSEIKNKMNQTVETARDKALQAKERASEISQSISRETKKQAHRVDEKVKHDPWKFIGIASIVGAVTGFFLGRHKR